MNDRFSKSVAQQGAQARFALAVDLHQRGRLREAEAAYRELLGRDPPHAPALHYLGLLLLQQGRAETAADLIRRSLAQQERNPEAHYHLGLALARLGQFANVVTHNQRAVDSQPGYVEAHLNLGNGLKALGKWLKRKQPTDAIGLAPDLPELISTLPISSPSAVAPMRRLRRSNARWRYVPTIRRR